MDAVTFTSLPGMVDTFAESTRPYPRTQTRYVAFGRSGIKYRPRSSVTTILANFVGRSDVSAMTHTPASGPFAPATTPPMSLAPTCGGSAAGCASSRTCQAVSTPTMAIATASLTCLDSVVVFIAAILRRCRRHRQGPAVLHSATPQLIRPRSPEGPPMDPRPASRILLFVATLLFALVTPGGAQP